MSTPLQRQPPREPDPQEQAALAWVARIDRGLTAAEQGEFERWLAADTRHARLFADFDGTWTMLDRMHDLPATSGRRGTSTAKSAVVPMSRGVARRFPLMAAAAAVAVIFAGVFLFKETRPRSDAAPAPNYTASASTQRGELRTVALPDGSTIRLNTASAVNVRYDAHARTVQLGRGEAHFVVAPDAARPFTVLAAGVAVRAVGTAFNVRFHPDTIEVLVTEGRVAVRERPEPARTPASAVKPAPLSPRTLAAGESLALPRGDRAAAIAAVLPPPTVLTPAEVERALAWQERRLEFAAAPLATMVAEFNRYNRHQLVIADPELATQRFGGTFRADDPAGFVRVLEANFRVLPETKGDETRLRIQR